jgi:hypothetical protein
MKQDGENFLDASATKDLRVYYFHLHRIFHIVLLGTHWVANSRSIKNRTLFSELSFEVMDACFADHFSQAERG